MPRLTIRVVQVFSAHAHVCAPRLAVHGDEVYDLQFSAKAYYQGGFWHDVFAAFPYELLWEAVDDYVAPGLVKGPDGKPDPWLFRVPTRLIRLLRVFTIRNSPLLETRSTIFTLMKLVLSMFSMVRGRRFDCLSVWCGC